MEERSGSEPRLDELVTLQELQQRLERHFPSLGSLQWYVRTHRQSLIEERAMFEVARRVLVHPVRFDAAVLKIGAQRYASRH